MNIHTKSRNRSERRRCRHLNKASKIADMYLMRYRCIPLPKSEPPREAIASPLPKGPQLERPCLPGPGKPFENGASGKACPP